jgi:hypothetical protein
MAGRPQLYGNWLSTGIGQIAGVAAASHFFLAEGDGRVLSAFRFARLDRMPRKHFMSASCAIRGSFFDFVDDPWKHPGHEDRAARFVGDDLLGNFDKGKEADFVAIDWNAGQSAMRWRQSLIVEGGPKTVDQAAQLLFGVMMVGDDRNVDETWIAGERAYKKMPSPP